MLMHLFLSWGTYLIIKDLLNRGSDTPPAAPKPPRVNIDWNAVKTYKRNEKIRLADEKRQAALDKSRLAA